MPTITVFVASFDVKVFNCMELLKPTEIATIEIFDKRHGLRYYKSHICCFLSVLKKTTNTLHLYSCVAA